MPAGPDCLMSSGRDCLKCATLDLSGQRGEVELAQHPVPRTPEPAISQCQLVPKVDGPPMPKVDWLVPKVAEQPLRRNVQRFKAGLVFEAHRLVYHSTLCRRVTKKKKRRTFHRRISTRSKVEGPLIPEADRLVPKVAERREARLPHRSRANMAHVGQPRPDSGLSVQVKVFKPF